MQIILASQSLFRRKALDILGLQYKVIPSNFDEKSLRHSDPLELAKKLAEAKALEVGKNNASAIIIAADLFVTLNGKIYEKPANEKEAVEMLAAFSSNSIEIISGLAVYNTASKKMLSSTDTCTAKFRKLNNHEIQDYVSRYPVTKFAGAFDSDGLLRFAESVNGTSFQTGMAINHLILFLRENRVKV